MSNHLPKIANKKTAKLTKKQSTNSVDDYPAPVETEDEKAFNNCNFTPFNPLQQCVADYNSNTKKSNKKVTLANEGTFRIRETDGDDDVFETHQNTIANILQNGSLPSANPNTRQFVHEKAIFQELTHLKRVQIQYGKVQEKVLVRSLINNFCKMHSLNPAHFRYTTFYSWEKFLYGEFIRHWLIPI